MATEIYTTGKYIEQNPTWHVEDSSWKAKQILKIIEKNDLELKTIAEVGCGAGEILRQLYLEMPSKIAFTGYEISPQAFELCQQKLQDRLNFYLADLTQERAEIFDLLLCIDVFEHIENYIGFLQDIKPKARHHIFHIPLDLSISSLLRVHPILLARQKVGHLHYFTKETALATLQDNGYEIIDYFYTSGATELNSKSIKTLLAKFPRKIAYQIAPDLAARWLGGYSLLVLCN
jgi:2-polyprenyl-3-methyl-5-hydroxy-6-metoxy-1,4-benzoquinol methylase